MTGQIQHRVGRGYHCRVQMQAGPLGRCSQRLVQACFSKLPGASRRQQRFKHVGSSLGLGSSRRQQSHQNPGWTGSKLPDTQSPPHTRSISGTSPCVISCTNAISGRWSMTWKCSTAWTDLSDFQFLNQTTCPGATREQNVACTYRSIASRASAVRSPVAGSSGSSNLVQTTRWMISVSTPYGQSLYRMRMSSIYTSYSYPC